MWDKMMSVMDNWYFIIGCLVALVVLIGLYLFLKNKNKDEE
jgi:LPXTG-motif cell wall-anchored protein